MTIVVLGIFRLKDMLLEMKEIIRIWDGITIVFNN